MSDVVQPFCFATTGWHLLILWIGFSGVTGAFAWGAFPPLPMGRQQSVFLVRGCRGLTLVSCIMSYCLRKGSLRSGESPLSRTEAVDLKHLEWRTVLFGV